MSLESDIIKIIVDSGYRLTPYIEDEVEELASLVEDENEQLDEDDDSFRDSDETEWEDEDGDEPIDPASE